MSAEGGGQTVYEVGDAAGPPPPPSGRMTADGVRLLYGELMVAAPDQVRALKALRRVYEEDRASHAGKRWQPAALPRGAVLDEVMEAMGWVVEPGDGGGLLKLVPGAEAARYFPAWFEALAKFSREGSMVLGVGEGGRAARWVVKGGGVQREFASWFDFQLHLDMLGGEPRLVVGGGDDEAGGPGGRG